MIDNREKVVYICILDRALVPGWMLAYNNVSPGAALSFSLPYNLLCVIHLDNAVNNI